MNMKCCKFSWVILGCTLLAGCSTISSSSISHWQNPNHRTRTSTTPSDPDFEYRGELSEFDVLGISRGGINSESDIRRALEDSKPVKLRPGSSILLIQSGALIPDGPMVAELSKHFHVVPFSGIPSMRRIRPGFQTESPDPENYSKLLRLTAARGGTGFIVCYWGMLDSGSDRLATKMVSWVPVVHWVVPDERQYMRIQLKVAVVDVRSGSWSVFSPAPLDDARVSTGPHRGTVDQKQVEHLKGLAYAACATELVRAMN
jgi:hypothetical protein